jgi:hypothetical protein
MMGLFPGAVGRQFLKVSRATLEETRAWANFELLEILSGREERDWARFGRLRQRAEETSEQRVGPSLPLRKRVPKAKQTPLSEPKRP